MHEIHEKAKCLCEMKKKIFDWTKCKLEDNSIDIDQAGKLVDMIKDLSEAEKDVYKSAYYCEVTKAMKEEAEMMDGEGRMGYDNWRTSSGRFANKGTGHYMPGKAGPHTRSGYPWPAEGDWRPEFDKGYMMDGMHPDGRMGYVDPDLVEVMYDDKHGKAYKDWQLAKRHYTETKSDSDKREMSEHAKEHMADTVMSIKEIWMSADPQLREKIKKDLGAMMAELK